MLFCFPIRTESIKTKFLSERAMPVKALPLAGRMGNKVVSAIQNTVSPNNPEHLHPNPIIL
jgi:hypothetical protein